MKAHLARPVMISLELEGFLLEVNIEVYFKFYFCFFSLLREAFGSRGSAGLVSVRRHKMLSLCQRQTAADNSKMDLLLAKTESITDAGPPAD